jgi:hypothetical protein
VNQPARIVITCPADAVAAVPYLLGFVPADSLVIIGFGGQGTFVVRLDLVDRADYSALLHQLYGLMIRNTVDAVVIVGYGSEDRAVPLLREVEDALSDILTIKEVLRVDGGRWWSLMCTDPSCCPTEGTPYDSSTTKVAAQATFAGIMPYGSREEMAASLAPVDGQDRVWMQAETERAEAELLRDGPHARLLVTEGLPLVEDLIAQDRRLTDREVARLSVVLTHLRVRDEAWVRCGHLDRHQQKRLWRDVTRRAIGEYAAAPAALLAYVTYLSGDGALAGVALDRCLTAVPFYSMAGLLRGCITSGLPPQVVREKFSMTPADLADAYDRATGR